MKLLKQITAAALTLTILAAPLAGFAADEKKAEKPKAYPLKTCVVSGEKLGGDMGDPYVFTQDTQEVKLCCKDCLKDFKKDTAKYMKKIETASKEKQK
jgi:hypothetical protein